MSTLNQHLPKTQLYLPHAYIWKQVVHPNVCMWYIVLVLGRHTSIPGAWEEGSQACLGFSMDSSTQYWPSTYSKVSLPQSSVVLLITLGSLENKKHLKNKNKNHGEVLTYYHAQLLTRKKKTKKNSAWFFGSLIAWATSRTSATWAWGQLATTTLAC